MPRILYSLKTLKNFVKKEKSSNICIITSKKLLKKLGWAIKEIGISKKNIVFIPDGESAKEWSEIEKLIKSFIKLKLDRNSIIIALGGGTIGDSVGFASAIYLRGVRFIQIPTTLLAQVDSAHGGKTGINFLDYKNQIGAIHLPIAIVIDLRFLGSLNKEQIVDGLGEIIKAGIIKDPSILELLKKENARTLLKSHQLKTIINKAIKVKQYYTDRDLEDKNIRQILNFGHTIGHSIELKHQISHGRAVIIGMIQELKISEALKITSPRVRQNLLSLLGNLGIEIDISLKPDWKRLIRDKKIIGDDIYLPIIKRVGGAKLKKIKLKKLIK